jgi:hypothetical protein
MPHSTFAYPFEWKMLDAVVALAGDDMKQFTYEEGGIHIFYDPFDPPEYRWLKWSGLGREAAEKLLGVSFEPIDFVNLRTRQTIEFPSDWGVMF